jgi:hypothetical protein
VVVAEEGHVSPGVAFAVGGGQQLGHLGHLSAQGGQALDERPVRHFLAVVPAADAGSGNGVRSCLLPLTILQGKRQDLTSNDRCGIARFSASCARDFTWPRSGRAMLPGNAKTQGMRGNMRVCTVMTMTFVALLASVDAHAINKCKDASGKVTYQDEACDDSSKAQVMKVPQKAPPAAASAKGGAPASPASAGDNSTPGAGVKLLNREMLGLAAMHATLENCARVDSAGRRKYLAALSKWRSENAESLKRHENTEAYQSILQRVREENGSNQSEATRENLRIQCEQKLLPSL